MNTQGKKWTPGKQRGKSVYSNSFGMAFFVVRYEGKIECTFYFSPLFPTKGSLLRFSKNLKKPILT